MRPLISVAVGLVFLSLVHRQAVSGGASIAGITQITPVFFIPPTPAYATTLFGNHFNHNHVDTMPRGCCNGAVYPYPVTTSGIFRFWGSSTTWAATEKTKDHWDFSRTDDYLAELQHNGITDAMWVFGEFVPPWAAKLTPATCDQKHRSGTFCNPPKDVDSTNQFFRNHVAKVASHFVAVQSTYGVHLAAYEIWNEFTRQANIRVGTQVSWQGTNAEMLRLAEDARCIITGRGGPIHMTGESCNAVMLAVTSVNLCPRGVCTPVDPTAVIVAPSSNTFGSGTYIGNYNSYFSTVGALAAAEVIAFHNYPQDGIVADDTAEKAYSESKGFIGRLTNSISGKPLWSTEGAYGGVANLADPDLQAAFVAKYYILLTYAGYARVYYYGYDFTFKSALWVKNQEQYGSFTCNEMSGPPYGLGLNQGCILKDGIAYQQVYNWIVGSTLRSPCILTGNAWECGYTDPNGKNTLAVWDQSKTCSGGTCTTSSYPAVGNLDPQYTKYADLMGVVTTIRAGTQHLNIGIKPILLSQ